MTQLRRKLEADPARPKHLLTEPGMGYRFQPQEYSATTANHGSESTIGLEPRGA